MSEEVKITEEKECKCFCQSEGFKRFLSIALGTFVGVYAALSLFTAIHKPPMVPHHQMHYGPRAQIAAPCPCKHRHHFDKSFKKDRNFEKLMKEQKGPSPFEAHRDVK